MADTVIGNIAVRIRARNEQLVAGLKGANKAISNFGSKFRQDFGALALASGAAAAAIGAAAVKSIKAFGEQEQAIASLNQALANQGIVSEQTSQELQDYAASLQQVTTFGDETIISLQAQLVSFGLTGDALKAATDSTLDFAAAKKIDLKAAADLVGKAFVGETGSLSRYGIVIDKNIPKSQKFGAVLEKLNDSFGGQAQAQRQTTLGQLKAMENAFGDLQEVLGSFLAGPATEFAVWATGFIERLQESIITIRGTSGSLQELGITLVSAVVQGLADAARGVMEFIQTITGVGPVLRLLGVDIDAVNAKIDTQIQKMNDTAQMHLQTTQQRIATERLRAQQEQQLRNQESQSKVLNLKNLAASEVVIEQERQEEMKRIAKEADDFTAEMQKAAEERQQELEAQRQEAFNTHRNRLTSIANESETLMTSIFDRNLSEREKKQRAFRQVMGIIQRQITNAVIASMARQKAAAVTTSAVEAQAQMAPTAAGYFKATAGIPFVGQAIALGFIATAFAFINSLIKFQEGGIVPGAGTRDTVPALLTPGERVLTREENRAFSTGRLNPNPINVNISVSGQFLEADPSKWQTLIRSKLIPEIRRITQSVPTGPFNRFRGAP